MYRRLLTAASAATLSLSLLAGAAGAQEGPPGPIVPAGDPNCHGLRMSAPARLGEKFTPRERFEILVEHDLDPLVETMGDYHARVRESCGTPLPEESGLHQD